MAILLTVSPALCAPALQWIKMEPPASFAWSTPFQRGPQKEDTFPALRPRQVMAELTGNRSQDGMRLRPTQRGRGRFIVQLTTSLMFFFSNQSSSPGISPPP